MFAGPLRALSNLYDYIGHNPETLLAELEAALRKRGEIQDEQRRREFAKRIAATLLQALSFAFISKAGQSANSESLLEEVYEVVRKNGTLAFKLVELYVRLDSPKPLPRALLSDLYKESKDALMPSRLVRLMVLNRLYMFKTTEKDMQWLSAELKLDLEIQHSISYKETRQRRLKSS